MKRKTWDEFRDGDVYPARVGYRSWGVKHDGGARFLNPLATPTLDALKALEQSPSILDFFAAQADWMADQ